MISEARLNANRANALKSTGPTSEEGKAISRLNSTTHGLSGNGVSLSAFDPDLVAERVAAWTQTQRPTTLREKWLVEQVALATIRIDHCRIEENGLRVQTSQRAAVCWDEERKVDAEAQGAMLHRNPPLMLAKMRRTLQGSVWLRERWVALEAIARLGDGDWDEKQRALAIDMLGVPLKFRESGKHLPAGPDGESLAKVARGEIVRIDVSIANGLAYLDDREQKMAEEGVSLVITAPARLLRRYEAEAWKRYWWADRELKAGRPFEISRARNEPKPQPEPKKIPAPVDDQCDEEIADEAEHVEEDAVSTEDRQRVQPRKVHRNRKSRRAAEARERHAAS